MLLNNLHDFFVQATQANTAQARTNAHLQEIPGALRTQSGMQVFQYFDQRQHHVLSHIQNTITFAPPCQAQIIFGERMQTGRLMLRGVINVLHNQQG